MSELWTPGQRPANQYSIGIGKAPEGFVLNIQGMPFFFQPDGTVSTMPQTLESIEGIANTILGSCKKAREQLAALQRIAQINGDGGLELPV